MIYLKEYNGEIFYEEIDPSLFYYLEPSDLTPYYDKIEKWLETIKMRNGADLYQSDLFKTVSKQNQLGTIIDKLIFTLKDETQKYTAIITIKVDNDEWFHVMVDEWVYVLRTFYEEHVQYAKRRVHVNSVNIMKYYKCDQLDGLFQLITDKIESKV